jgi:DNA-binding HxlR family transcriptional regulator
MVSKRGGLQTRTYTRWQRACHIATLRSPDFPKSHRFADPAYAEAAQLTSRHLLSNPAAGERANNAASCPLEFAIHTIGGRWKLHILRELVLAGPQRYNSLLGNISAISAKELTRNLRELEAAGLLEQVAQEAGRVYALTTLGREIEAPFRALGIFGEALANARRLRGEQRAANPEHQIAP